MHPELHVICTRLERAQAAQNLACARAAGGEVLELPGALGVFLAPGHMLNQGLALGLGAPLPAADLDRLEAFLGRGGGPVVVELAAGADPELAALLSARGYRIRQFQQVWRRSLVGPLPVAAAEVRPVRPDEADLAARVMLAGFTDQDDLEGLDPGAALDLANGEGTTVFLVFADGVPAGAGTLGLHGGVAALSGTSVRPRFRGRGLQRALIAARLDHARAAGCAEACSATVPGGASQASLERCGFRVAYPKLEWVHDPLP